MEIDWDCWGFIVPCLLSFTAINGIVGNYWYFIASISHRKKCFNSKPTFGGSIYLSFFFKNESDQIMRRRLPLQIKNSIALI